MTEPDPRPRVLLVDDEPDLLTILSSLLEEEGYSVATATTGPEAVALARGEHFDVVLTDLKLPGIDGIDVLEQIGEIDPRARLVLMTGFVSDEIRAMLASQGYPCLLKPFDLEEVVAVMWE
jgi:CheY-like chemotaxis protein